MAKKLNKIIRATHNGETREVPLKKGMQLQHGIDGFGCTLEKVLPDGLLEVKDLQGKKHVLNQANVKVHVEDFKKGKKVKVVEK